MARSSKLCSVCIATLTLVVALMTSTASAGGHVGFSVHKTQFGGHKGFTGHKVGFSHHSFGFQHHSFGHNQFHQFQKHNNNNNNNNNNVFFHKNFGFTGHHHFSGKK